MPTGSISTTALEVGSTMQEDLLEMGIGLARGLMQPDRVHCTHTLGGPLSICDVTKKLCEPHITPSFHLVPKHPSKLSIFRKQLKK